MKTLVIRSARLARLRPLLAQINAEGCIPDVLTVCGSEEEVRAAGNVSVVYAYAPPVLTATACTRDLRYRLRHNGYARIIIMYCEQRGRGYDAIEHLAQAWAASGGIMVWTPGEALVEWQPWWAWLRRLPDATLQRWDMRLTVLLAGIAALLPRARARRGPEPRRILHVMLSMHTGGGQQQLAMCLPRFDRRRYAMEVALCGSGPRDHELPRDLPVFLLEQPGEWCAGLWTVRLWRLWRLLRQRGYALVQGWMFFANVYAATAAAFAGIPSLAYVMNVHDWKEMPAYRRWWYRPLDFLLARSATKVIGNCCTVADDFRVWAQAPRCSTVNSGIVPDAEQGPAAEREAARRQFGLPAHARLLGTTARLLPEKDIANLLAALRLLRDLPDIACVIAGSGPLLAELQQQADGLPVHFITEEIGFAPLRAALDLFVLPSACEGLPIALLAAGGCGLPVVATAVGGVPEIITDGETGWLVPPHDSEALAAALRAALADPQEARRRGAALRARILTRWHGTQTVAGLQRAYDVLLHGRG